MIVATISAYLMNRHWTYNDRPKSAMRRETRCSCCSTPSAS